MRGRVLLVGAILGAATLVGAPATAMASAPDPYSGGIATECSISVPAHLKAGHKVRITYGVDANSPTPPTGHVDLAVLADGDTIWSKTVSYRGGTHTVVGPAVEKGPDYRATARFRPSDNTFKRCHAGTQFAVAAVNDHNGPNDNNPGGLLPDTGGPALLWLLLGAGLVGAGGGTVVYARRRNAPATV